MPAKIPEVVILRLPLYARILTQLEEEGTDVVSSQALGDLLQATPAQIRKDLSYFGRFGKQGRGYNVRGLQRELRQILGLDRTWNMALVGVGQLGRALLTYGGFENQGFRMVAAFDADPGKVGSEVGALIIQHVADLRPTVAERSVQVGIVAVPAAYGQDVTDELVACGVKGILNCAQFQPRVPDDVWVRDIDPVVARQSMT
ncbi:MAG: redox-sensing transcriptional repressor Rex, partial [Chloroflexi bacterium]|nr:redox-sensing transcriptional repressor Rex [Chloroflexota bacterium]